tara:strand:+ start:3416 stop:5623 length:2208 start_codon:yes stop_codon:yes gene_type:complete
MPYENQNENFRNIKYLSKDFTSLKQDLINYAKAYFPDTYNDFNETSPGMMLMEMSAYVGDVLSFYIDNQFKEMLLPTTEERRNILYIADSLGYKVKASIPAITELTVTQTVEHDPGAGDDPRIPNVSQLMTFNKGLQVKASTNSSIVFETVNDLDFKITGSSDQDPIPAGQDQFGLTNLFVVERKVMAISGKTKTLTFDVKNPSSFLKLTIPDKDVVNILSVIDSSGHEWFEVDYLAQDKITLDEHREDPYSQTLLPVEYKVKPGQSIDKRFIVRTNSDNTTSMVFGNGLLKEKYSVNRLQNIWVENQDINALINSSLPKTLSPHFNDTYQNTLGESPAHTTLTVTYRVGGGIKSNVPQGDLNTFLNTQNKVVGNSERISTLSVSNLLPAMGGMDKENVEDIRNKVQSYFSAQDRCVTQKDYEARVLSMPPRYGSVAKAFVRRRGFNEITASSEDGGVSSFVWADVDNDGSSGGSGDQGAWDTLFSSIMGATADAEEATTITSAQKGKLNEIRSFIGTLGSNTTSNLLSFQNLNLYLMSYDSNKNLAKTTDVIKNNIANYISQYKILSDEVQILDGSVINFGVKFVIEAKPGVNKADLKMKVIRQIIEYFEIGKMQFNQIIYTSDIENQIYNNVDGIRIIKELILTQDKNDLNISNHLTAHINDGTGVTTDGRPANGVCGPNQNTYGFGYITEFKRFYEDFYGRGKGVILPPNTTGTPGVFELKNPLDNIKGVVV